MQNTRKQNKSYEVFMPVTWLILSMYTICSFSCSLTAGKTIDKAFQERKILIVVADDRSFSTEFFAHPDTGYIGSLCRTISKPGGTIVIYGVGNPTDQSGLRCEILPLPEVNSDVMMEKQIEQKDKVDNIKRENDAAISKFIANTQKFVLTDSSREMNTDLNGFFSKADILLNEPQYENYDRYLFIISDGINSINNHDAPAQFNLRTSNIHLCLCGWKVPIPDTIKAILFESPKGFSDYINQSLNSKL